MTLAPIVSAVAPIYVYAFLAPIQTRNYRFDGKSLAPFSAAFMNYFSTGALEFGTADQIHVRHVIGWRK